MCKLKSHGVDLDAIFLALMLFVIALIGKEKSSADILISRIQVLFRLRLVNRSACYCSKNGVFGR